MSNGFCVPAQISGCITVDRSNDSFLSKLRQCLGQPPRHGTREVAGDNLVASLTTSASRTVNIVGYGYPGEILTGTTAPTGNSDRYLGDANAGDWTAGGQPNLQTIANTPITLARLWGCNTGAGSDGARLVWEFARTVNAPAEAPTGLVFFDPESCLCLQTGSIWQHADPTAAAPPARINAPKPYTATPAMNSLVLGSPGGDFVVPVSAVTAISIKPSDLDPFPPVLGPLPPVSVTGDEARRLATVGQFIEPHKSRAVPGALITGTLVITFQHDGAEEERSFAIYNNLLLEDATMTDLHHYYFADLASIVPAG